MNTNFDSTQSIENISPSINEIFKPVSSPRKFISNFDNFDSLSNLGATTKDQSSNNQLANLKEGKY